MISPSSRANGIGFLAILAWSFTALIISFSTNIPPLFLAGTSLLIGFGGFAVMWLIKNISILSVFKMPLLVYATGIIGITGYYGFYISGLKTAPIAEANLINYLWPILLVLFSTCLPKHKLQWFHLVGACLGLLGVAIVINGRQSGDLFQSLKLGHILALMGAIVWAGYSTLSRYFHLISNQAVGVFLLIAGFILCGLHIGLEEPFTPSAQDCIVIALSGIVSPLGSYLWDIGMKKGDVAFVAVLAFLTPLLSTLWLIVFGRTSIQPALLIGGLTVFAGTLFAGLDKISALKNTLSKP